VNYYASYINCQRCGYEIRPPFEEWTLCPECGAVVEPHVPVHRTAAGLIAIALIGAFAFVFIPAGSRSGPVGVLLCTANLSYWGFPMAIGWLGVLATAATPWVRRPIWHAGVAGGGALLLFASLVLFALTGGVRVPTFVTAVPFVGFLALRVASLIRFIRQQRHPEPY
jgi:hypothetical protein